MHKAIELSNGEPLTIKYKSIGTGLYFAIKYKKHIFIYYTDYAKFFSYYDFVWDVAGQLEFIDTISRKIKEEIIDTAGENCPVYIDIVTTKWNINK